MNYYDISKEMKRLIEDISEYFKIEYGVSVFSKFDDMKILLKKLNGELELDIQLDECKTIINEDGSFVIKLNEISNIDFINNLEILKGIGYLLFYSNIFQNDEIKKFNSNEFTSGDLYIVMNFALACLLPKLDYISHLYNTINHKGVVDIEEMSDYFNIPRRYIIMRGHFLGVID